MVPGWRVRWRPLVEHRFEISEISPRALILHQSTFLPFLVICRNGAVVLETLVGVVRGLLLLKRLIQRVLTLLPRLVVVVLTDASWIVPDR